MPVGNRPTGYTHTGEVIEEEAGAVRAVFAAFLAGASLKAVARALSGDRDELTAGVPTLPRPSYRAAVEWNERHPDRPPHELPAEWIGNTYLDAFERASPAFLNSTGLMQPSVEWILRSLHRRAWPDSLT